MNECHYPTPCSRTNDDGVVEGNIDSYVVKVIKESIGGRF